MTDLALFDLDPRTGDDVTHVLMPCMGYACGESILTVRGGFQVGITDWDAITCPGCREPGEAALVDEMRAQQGRQAVAA